MKNSFRKLTEIFQLRHIKNLIPDFFKATYFLHWLVVDEYLWGFFSPIWELFHQKKITFF